MSRSVDFLFDYGSPAAYLAWTQLGKLAADTGATVVMKPILLGGVFQATGNRAPITVPAKGSYLFKDLNRYARAYGVPLAMNPHFPINTITLMRIDVALSLAGDTRLDAYRTAVFNGVWAEQKNMGDPATVAAVLAPAGFEADELLEMASDPQVKETLKTWTQEAVERGVFGAPTFFVGGEMFWGQDRLDFVRSALKND
ncbi:MAG: 2-hydroxychromene-2-carboxylate isomerase [Burkholderiaceae bacterium]|nr:2-hydroxychromene-2-carboxylate isomerase [Rhodoferax sp.]MCB2003509.1 2-hydroxychromene-2-carboxylate isomerase [Rhodoferax sp.]MCB2028946.1 2-hydroxychromene-2-carboxylate isomerase [Rhodoferax sp.]MCB2039847.1 2-hydroxychromene-2-carboxylate isomerase [Rhodoferax sp.]MCP5264437.1 2-hydroxychromene-2-carboxylate isomerase [Rhodoferax sp.]